jgi:hypothetical protein
MQHIRQHIRKVTMPGIDESLPFVSLKIAVLTVSDTRQFEDDKSGSTLVDRLTTAGHKLADRAIVTDDVEVSTVTSYRVDGVEMQVDNEGRVMLPEVTVDNAAALAKLLGRIGQQRPASE